MLELLDLCRQLNELETGKFKLLTSKHKSLLPNVVERVHAIQRDLFARKDDPDVDPCYFWS